MNPYENNPPRHQLMKPGGPLQIELPQQSDLPPWIRSLGDQAFERYGVIAERVPGARTICNVEVHGGLPGAPYGADWGDYTASCHMFALAIVRRMIRRPDPKSSPVGPYLTESFRQEDVVASPLLDGTMITATDIRLARMLLSKRIGPHRAEGSFTLDRETLIGDLVEFIQKGWPDAPSRPNRAVF